MCQVWNCQATDNKRRNCHYRGNEGFFSPFLDSPPTSFPPFLHLRLDRNPISFIARGRPKQARFRSPSGPRRRKGTYKQGKGRTARYLLFCHWCHYVTATNNRLLARARRSYGGTFIGCSFFSSFLGCVPSSLSPSLCSSPALAAFT